MELLSLILDPISKSEFSISAGGSAGEGKSCSKLPFFDNNTDRLNTLTKTLDATNFDLDYFEEEELDWMIKANLIKKDRSAFHPDVLENIGRKLFQALFPSGSEVEKKLERVMTLAEDNQTKLHIQLQFYANQEEPCWLTYYPWELIHNGQKFLAQGIVTFSRYISHNSIPPKVSAVDKINILMVSSTAFDCDNDLEKLPDDEQKAIYQGIQKARRKKNISLNKLKPCTFKKLRNYLTQNQEKKVPHVIHFDGHGIYGKRCTNDKCRKVHQGIKINKCDSCHSSLHDPQGYLVFEDDYGEADYISASRFGDLIKQYSFSHQKQQGIFLVVLSACKSAMALAGDSDFNGIAQNLISRRIPAVVAMQYLIDISAASDFAEQFYRSLGQRNSLATVVSHAREAMDFERNQWYRPILYLRWKDNEGGELFTKDFTAVSHNFEQLNQEVSNQLDRASSAKSLLEIPRENARRRAEYLKQAADWLADENIRLDLASNITKYVLKAKSFSAVEARQIFTNLYHCLNWLLKAFQEGTGRNIDNLINQHLSQNPLEIYITALEVFKDEAKKYLQENQEVVSTVHRYTNILIKKISSYR